MAVTVAGHFNEFLVWAVDITGLGSNSSTGWFRGRNLPGSSYIVFGTWSSGAAVTLQLQGSEDGVNAINIGQAITVPSGGTQTYSGILNAGGIYSHYQFVLIGGDTGTNISISCRFNENSP